MANESKKSKGTYIIWSMPHMRGRILPRRYFANENPEVVIKEAKKLFKKGESKVNVTEVDKDGNLIKIIWESPGPILKKFNPMKEKQTQTNEVIK